MRLDLGIVCRKIKVIRLLENNGDRCMANKKETDMFDFIVNGIAEIADFFITFWVDNVVWRFADAKARKRNQ